MMARVSVAPLGLCLALAAFVRAGEPVMPLVEVRPGMQGVGRTVFEGARVDEFGVRILGVLENAVGPRQNLILARLDGGPLAETGVISGMSGSPVFIDGRLIGAVAYSFPFGKEPIAGITPIEEMTEAAGTAARRSAAARFQMSSARDGLPAPLDRASISAALRSPLRSAPDGGAGTPALPAAGALRHLALPLVFSGFEPAAFDWAKGIFSAMGFTPVMGGAGGGTGLEPLPDLAPGAAVGVSLIEGDLDLSATGTVTRIDQDRVYAFGHPLYNLGPTQFPLKKAWVYSVFPSLQASWKMAAATEAVGTMDQDRATTIAGRLGVSPRMIPIEVKLRSARAGDRTLRYRIVDDELLTPLLAYVSLVSVLQGYERAQGAATLRVDARLVLGGGREVSVKDLLATEQPGEEVSAAIAGPLALVVGNDFEKAVIERIQVTIEAEEAKRSAAIVRAWVDAPQPLRPGTAASVRVRLRTYGGDIVDEVLPLTIPASAPAGTYNLLVADAATMDAVERREMQQAFAARDLGHLLRALNELRAGNTVYARLAHPGAGAIVGGVYLPSLPASVLSVLRSPDQGTSVVPLADASIWKGTQSVDYAVSGARQLTLTVQP